MRPFVLGPRRLDGLTNEHRQSHREGHRRDKVHGLASVARVTRRTERGELPRSGKRLLAGLVVLTFVLIDVIATEPERDTRWHIIGLGVTIYLAIHTKLYGAVLGPICVVYLAMHGRQFVVRSVHLRSKVSILIGVFTALALVLLAAAFGINPLLDLAEGAGYGSHIDGIQNIIGSLSMLGFAALFTFQVALLFSPPALHGVRWRLRP